MSKIVMYAHGGSGNHGCEAIIRATVGMMPNQTISLLSRKTYDDEKYGISSICNVLPHEEQPSKASLSFLYAYALLKLRHNYFRLDQLVYKKPFEVLKKGDVALSVGGDNYCYADYKSYILMHDMAIKRKAKTVLWGCSVEPELVQAPEIAADLARYDLITARETISYEALKKVNPNTVLVSDPAFTLQRVDLPLPKGWQEGNMIGINASPMVLSNASDGTLAFDAYCCLIETILQTTNCGIALIPHVVWAENDDRKLLQELYDRFKRSGRVILIDDCNCMELKGYIARCRMFVGARTHATIAAYSTGVPTLVLGYSVKSRGIARDLFGTEENYVLPVQGLANVKELAKGFWWIMEHENSIREHLKSILPEYIEKASIAVSALESVK